MKRVKKLSSMGILLAILSCVAVLSHSAEAKAKAKVAAIEGMRYNVSASLQDNLKSLIGKRVYVTLDSGKTLAGFVKEVGNNLVHLEKLEGKDFFDALIRIEDINAIDVKFRDFQR
jgi:small nuclear ribonucleoprotein (snRNP)-like protein